MSGETTGQFRGVERGLLPGHQSIDDLRGQLTRGDNPMEYGKPDGGMNRHEQPPAAAAAKPSQTETAPAAQLFVAVDDQQIERIQSALPVQIERQAALGVMQFNKQGFSAGAMDGRDQGGQQRRLAGAVFADDFAPPAVFAQPPDERLGIFAGREDKRQRAWPDAPRAEGVGGRRCLAFSGRPQLGRHPVRGPGAGGR